MNRIVLPMADGRVLSVARGTRDPAVAYVDAILRLALMPECKRCGCRHLPPIETV